jgi:Skp family chaperone for outer membrane proteins
MRRKGLFFIVGLCGVLAWLMIVEPLYSADQRTTKRRSGGVGAVAVVDVVRVFNSYKRRADVADEFAKRANEIEQKIKDWETKLKAQQLERDEYKPQSEEYARRNRAILEDAIKFRTFQEVEQADMRIQQTTMMQSIYSEILAAIGQIASKRGISLVLYLDDMDMRSKNPDELQTKIRLKKVLYASEDIDLTDVVLQDLNASYVAK